MSDNIGPILKQLFAAFPNTQATKAFAMPALTYPVALDAPSCRWRTDHAWFIRLCLRRSTSIPIGSRHAEEAGR